MAESILRRIKETNCYCMYDMELDFLLAIDEVLNPIGRNKTFEEVYEENYLEQIREKHPMLVELSKSFSVPLGMMLMEKINSYEKEDFSLTEFLECIKKDGVASLIGQSIELTKEEAEAYFSDCASRIRLVSEYSYMFKSVMAMEYLATNFSGFVDEIYDVVKACMTSEAKAYVDTHFSEITNWHAENEKNLMITEALEYSQQLMGKTFSRRGPYEKFYFMPCFFISYKSVRFMNPNQVLFYHVKINSLADENQISETLKMLSDKTRFRILKVLKEKGHMKGVEISQYMELSTSTVSHHMTQLRSAGLIHEEMEGTTKIYSVNQKQVEECVKYINNALLEGGR